MTRKTFKSALMAGAAVATVAGMAPAFAQDKVEKVVVTGSRIPQKGLSSVSPVSTITNAEAKLQGATTAESLLNNMPQVLANQGAQLSNGSSGTASLDLRGLGPKRTLVLVNGRRLHPANILAPTADLNTIPVPLVERVELLTGGASAVYGADAVAGVVNFIMRKNFEGLEVGGQYGIFDHDNDDGKTRKLITDSGFSNADQHVDDGRAINLWGIMGANAPDGAGNVTMYVQYRHAQPVLQGERDFSNCTIADPPGPPTGRYCGGSSNGPTGRFTSVDDPNGTRFTASSTVPGAFRPFDPNIDTYNFNPTNYLVRPDERYLIGTQGHYQLAPDLEVYGEASFMEDNTTAQIAASGYFANSGPFPGGFLLLNCNNPFLQTGAPTVGTTQVTPFNALCGNLLPAPLGVGGTATVNIGRRFFESGLGRQDVFKTTSYRVVGGLRGEIDDWDYDISAQYGTASTPRAYVNDVSKTRAQRSLLVVDPDGAGPLAPVCQSVIDGTDPNCVPANIFTNGQLTGAAIAYTSGTGIRTTITKEQVVNASANGEVGLGSPWAQDNIALAFGGEYRFSALQHISDDVFSSGDLYGQGGDNPPVNGSYDVWEAFGEIQIPLVQDAPWAKSLDIEGGYRISDYDNAGITHTYKYGGSWMPTDDLLVRGSFQRAVRAPNVIELFTPAGQGLFAGRDLCAVSTSGTPSFYSAAQCAFTGMTLAQYTTANAVPAGFAFTCASSQCAGTFSGNPNLKPESSDTKSFGVVFTPTFLKGFTATVDYYDIFIDSPIQIQNANAIQVECVVSHNPAVCALIHRTAQGNILDTSTLGSGVSQITQNVGSNATSGIDYEVNYRFDLDNIGMGGALQFALAGNYSEKFEVNNGPGIRTYDCVGLFGPICGLPLPENKHRLRTTWATPWDVDLSLAWRYIGEVQLDIDTTQPILSGFCNGPCNVPNNHSIKAYDYFDISFRWAASDHISIVGGINNVTDEDPPILDSNVFGISSPPFGNGNTYPAVYDSLGRELFVSMTTRF
ncbi:MAG: TonB-dependent receptor [Alphaproteobacteria bacterium]|nr:TonB-dependent receptor [Alphaproteobacteria bacterium]